MFDVNSKNYTLLVGNVGQEPDFTTLDGGRKVVNLNICTNEGYKDESTGEVVEKAVWHSVTAFGPLADRIEKSGIKQGSRVMMECRINYSERTKEVDGKTHIYHNCTLIVESSMNLSAKPAVAA